MGSSRYLSLPSVRSLSRRAVVFAHVTAPSGFLASSIYPGVSLLSLSLTMSLLCSAPPLRSPPSHAAPPRPAPTRSAPLESRVSAPCLPSWHQTPLTRDVVIGPRRPVRRGLFLASPLRSIDGGPAGWAPQASILDFTPPLFSLPPPPLSFLPPPSPSHSRLPPPPPPPTTTAFFFVSSPNIPPLSTSIAPQAPLRFTLPSRSLVCLRPERHTAQRHSFDPPKSACLALTQY